ncbi:putative cytochrome oxidase subunit 2, partial [Listeria monocytogenes FSL F2-208]
VFKNFVLSTIVIYILYVDYEMDKLKKELRILYL